MAASRLPRLLAAGLAASFLVPAQAYAQDLGIITGTVSGTDAQPLFRARVTIAGTPLAVSTDATGSFRVSGVPAGAQTIEVRMLGYAPLSLPVEVFAGESFHLALGMTREPVVLPSVDVRADTFVNPIMQGFLERRQRGLGSFFDRRDLDAMQPREVTDILRRVPGLRLQVGADAYGGGNTVQTQRASGAGGNRICPMQFFIDGTPTQLPREAGINHFVSPDDVVGVEVYPGASQIPPQFNSGGAGSTARCGVVVIWTRSGPDRRRGQPTPARAPRR